MIKRMLSWGLILSLLLTLFPVTVLAAEETVPEDQQPPALAALCTCGGQPDESGVIVHKGGCPSAVQTGPSTGTEEPVTGTGGPAAGTEGPAASTEGPVTGTEEPTTGTAAGQN